MRTCHNEIHYYVQLICGNKIFIKMVAVIKKTHCETEKKQLVRTCEVTLGLSGVSGVVYQRLSMMKVV